MKQRIAVVSAIFAIFVFIIPSSTQKAHAVAWFIDDPQSFGQILDNADQSNSIQKQGYSVSTISDNMNGWICFMGGCSKNPQSIFYYGKSALAGINSYITAMYTTPAASTYLAVRDIGHDLGFIPEPVYAQGVGFSGLAALLPVWKVFRNIAYVLLAIVMIVVGFMVMFRRKIDPKTVVTIQNALPRIVVTLLLITFSYAIVGLMIDLMYLVMLFAYGLFQSTGFLPAITTTGLIGGGSQSTRDVITSGNLFQVFTMIFPDNFRSIGFLAGDMLGYTPGGTIGALATPVAAGVLTMNPVVGIAVGALTLGGPILLTFLLSLALIFLFIRLFLMFLSAYIQIILALIIGPIQILLDAVPGGNGFISWIKNLFSNLIVFPIAAIMFMLAMVFSQIGSKGGGSIWAPPFYTFPNQSVTSISALFAIGILMVIPSVVNGIKKALKAQAPVPVGPGAIFAPIGAATQQTIQAAYQFHFAQQALGQAGGTVKKMLGIK